MISLDYIIVYFSIIAIILDTYPLYQYTNVNTLLLLLCFFSHSGATHAIGTARMGTAVGAGAAGRPMTSVRAAGYSVRDCDG